MAHRLSPWRAVLGAGEPWQRRAGALAVVVGVVVAHGCIADRVSERMMDLTVYADMPQRAEAVFVREMEIAVPPPVAAPKVVAGPRAANHRRVKAVEPAASASERETQVAEAVAEAASEAASQPAMPDTTPQPTLAAASEPARVAVAEPSASAASSAPAAALPIAGAGSAPAFEWPASTRLSYVLTGNYRGEVAGTAQVEWIRLGNRYQVHLDVTIGLPILPLATRRMISDGVLTPEGLRPETFDEDSKIAGRDRRRSTIRFEPDAIVLPGGLRNVRWPGVQDAASQFVQLTFLFTTRPELLAPGTVIDMPLALPRHVDHWVYDVLEKEVLYTPFGTVEGVHLRPRRVAKKGGDLVAEMWIAPSLAYLPARIRIAQDEQTFIDLMIRRKPQLAAP